jgi:lipopolysaccharide biosynthesis regulator YciM
MKYILLIICLALIGCEKSDLNKELLRAYDYKQAGMIDEAEAHYQKLILSDDILDNEKWVIKNSLIKLYLDTNQLDKADKYMTLVYLWNSKSTLHSLMATNSSAVAEALYNDKKYVRAAFHFKNAAEYEEAAKGVQCDVKSVEYFYKAYDSAMKAGVPRKATEMRARATEILNYKICMENESAIKWRLFLDGRERAFR